MANIAILDLKPAGLELFSDSENYMVNLSDDELEISGGIVWTYYIYQGAAAAARSSQACVTVAGAAVRAVADAVDGD